MVRHGPRRSVSSEESVEVVRYSPRKSATVRQGRDKSGTQDAAPAGTVGTVLHSALLVAAAQSRNVVLDPGDCRALLADLAELKRLRIAGRQSTTPDATLMAAVEQVLAQRAKDDQYSTLNVTKAFRACLDALRTAFVAAKGGGR